MENRSAIWVFTTLLALACIYQLSFSWFTGAVEGDAESYAKAKVDSLREAESGLRSYQLDSARRKYRSQYLQEQKNEVIYPVFGYTYQECKEKEIKLGLDLKGGMSVVLEVSLEDLLRELSGNSDNEQFQKALRMAREKQKESGEGFITLFEESWNEIDPDAQMAAVFHSRTMRDKFPANASNEEIVSTLEEEARTAIKNTEKILRTRIDKFGVTQPTIQKQQFSGRIMIELPGVKDKERIRDYLQSTASLEFWEVYENQQVYPLLAEANNALATALNPADTTSAEEATGADNGSADEDGANGPETDTTSAQESEADTATDLLEEIGAEEEGTDTAVETGQQQDMTQAEYRNNNPLFARLRPAAYQDQQTGQSQLSEGAIVGYCKVSDTARVNNYLHHKAVRGIFPQDMRFLWGAQATENNIVPLYAIQITTRNNEAPLNGEVITNASQEFNYKGQVEVRMQMNSEGAETWKNLTGANVDEAIAIVLDNLVYSAPMVSQEIPNGRSSITMGGAEQGGQLQEAKDLANLLNVGALPAPARIVSENVIGPSLGQENIDSGLMSFIVALVVILFYMFFYYNGAGLASDIALIANLFFLIGSLASLQASLTLPGIAGIVLTIGIAVDANVLIYERVREELRSGKALRAAISTGYRKAYAAIIDANITTLLTAIILAIFGSGPIKGFATTLIIGIFTSLYSAILLTRLIFSLRTQRKKDVTFSNRFTKDAFKNINIAFLGKRKLFYGISGVVIAIGLFSFVNRQLNFGVEFTGGRTFIVRFDQEAQVQKIRSELGDKFVSEEGGRMPPKVKIFGNSNQVKVTTNYLIDDNSPEANEKVRKRLRSGLAEVGGNPEIVRSRKVDPTISDDILTSSMWAVFFALMVIFLYIIMRFRRWQYGFGALLAMGHDVLIVLALFSLLYGRLPFALEIDQAFIAAILTVVGYSINDTVVVFDRVREYLREHSKRESYGVVNSALNSTLSRTFNTSMSTFIVLLMIFLLGSETIRGFAFALMIGVIVGTYSSLFIATPTVFDLSKQLTKGAKK